ncbi:MAG: response regulator transcription factor [Bacteroidales bacterium]|nr:response regulator transcription factor [Bacteroidales bacterium]
MKYKCVIIDDEPLAIEVIKSHIGKLGFLEVAAEFSSAIEAFPLLSSQKTDLLFLDIQMPGIKGTDFLRTLVNPPRVILTTAYREYAFEGYELNVIDYLLKPISYERFIKAADKFLKNIESAGKSNESHPDEKFIYLNINKKVHKILVHEIIYVESVKDYLTIHTTSGNITAKHTISAFENLLPSDEFIRIHRSFIVSISKIKGFNAHNIDVSGKELPIGPNYHSQVFEKLKYPHFKI